MVGQIKHRLCPPRAFLFKVFEDKAALIVCFWWVCPNEGNWKEQLNTGMCML
ncbi:hypothetical protein Hanom_Chr02g00152581 [Helianthus anomalus]